MDLEELANILRSRETEPTEAVLEALMQAIGRQVGREDPQLIGGFADKLSNDFWQGFLATFLQHQNSLQTTP